MVAKPTALKTSKIKIGGNIRKWRNLRSLKQGWLAAKLGITKSALSNIENDKTPITLHRIEQIAGCLDVDSSVLFKDPLEVLLSCRKR
jgi:transcriptional regulator with XRE-family HTH domain